MADELKGTEIEVLARMMASSKGGIIEADPLDQPAVSRPTFYRIIDSLVRKGRVDKVGHGSYRCVGALKEGRCRSYDWAEALIEASDIARNSARLAGKIASAFDRHQALDKEECSRCPRLADCIPGAQFECPSGGTPPEELTPDEALVLAYLQVSAAKVSHETLPKVSRETHISKIDQGRKEEDKKVSHETLASEEEGRREDDRPAPTPTGEPSTCSRLQPSVPQVSPREILRRGIEESRAREASKGPTPRAMLNEAKALWNELLVRRMGEGFRPPPWGGKEHKEFPRLIASVGLDLTKNAICLYFTSWDGLRSENPWIDASGPTTGLFLHFADRLLASVQTGAPFLGRSARRTADEPSDGDGGADDGCWPGGEKAAPAP